MNLTIITVCWNAKADLDKTLNGVLKQSYRDMEYLIVDGGSTDGSIELLSEYKKAFADAGIAYRWISERDKGTYDAMNKGARMAQGEWVLYMNAGDSFYTDDALEKFLAHEIPNDCGYCFGDTYEEWDFGGGIAKYEDHVKDNPVMPFCHQSCFVRTELMCKYGFDESYRIIADHDLFYRMSNDGVKTLYVEEVVARYNGQYGLSAQNPLRLRLEGLRVYGKDKCWYYPLLIIKTYLRYGWIAWFKRTMPKSWTDAWMKWKRRRFVR